MTERNLNRRSFLKAGLALTSLTIVPRHVLGGPGYTPPSEKITRAIIGVGGMGKAHIAYDIGELLAVCDCDKRHLQEGLNSCREAGKPNVEGVADFRELLARKDIDVIHIATPPHWHAMMTILAAKAGKDVWCEKPLTRTIGEGLAVQKAIEETQRMLRINTWFRYEKEWYGVGAPVPELKRITAARLLGWPLKINLGPATGFDWKFNDWSGIPGLGEEPVPEALDYNMWLGPAPFKPYHSKRVHKDFRGYWDYDGGGLGDMGQHYMDPAQFLLEKDNESPYEIEADCPQQDIDAVTNFRHIRMKYRDGCELNLHGFVNDETRDLPVIEGPKGKIWPKLRSDIPNLREILRTLPILEPTVTDFGESVRTRQPFVLNEKNGHRSATLINLAKIAMRTDGVLRFDGDRYRFANNEQANDLLDEPSRRPWDITSLSISTTI